MELLQHDTICDAVVSFLDQRDVFELGRTCKHGKRIVERYWTSLTKFTFPSYPFSIELIRELLAKMPNLKELRAEKLWSMYTLPKYVDEFLGSLNDKVVIINTKKFHPINQQECALRTINSKRGDALRHFTGVFAILSNIGVINDLLKHYTNARNLDIGYKISNLDFKLNFGADYFSKLVSLSLQGISFSVKPEAKVSYLTEILNLLNPATFKKFKITKCKDIMPDDFKTLGRFQLSKLSLLCSQQLPLELIGCINTTCLKTFCMINPLEGDQKQAAAALHNFVAKSNILKIEFGHKITPLASLQAMHATGVIATRIKKITFRSDTQPDEDRGYEAKKKSSFTAESWAIILELFPSVGWYTHTSGMFYPAKLESGHAWSKSLRYLCLTEGGNVHSLLFSYVSACENLETLLIYDWEAQLKKPGVLTAPKLKRVDIHSCRVPILGFKDCPMLEKIIMENCEINNITLQGNLFKLSKICFDNCDNFSFSAIIGELGNLASRYYDYFNKHGNEDPNLPKSLVVRMRVLIPKHERKLRRYYFQRELFDSFPGHALLYRIPRILEQFAWAAWTLEHRDRWRRRGIAKAVRTLTSFGTPLQETKKRKKDAKAKKGAKNKMIAAKKKQKKGKNSFGDDFDDIGDEESEFLSFEEYLGTSDDDETIATDEEEAWLKVLEKKFDTGAELPFSDLYDFSLVNMNESRSLPAWLITFVMKHFGKAMKLDDLKQVLDARPNKAPIHNACLIVEKQDWELDDSFEDDSGEYEEEYGEEVYHKFAKNDSDNESDGDEDEDEDEEEKKPKKAKKPKKEERDETGKPKWTSILAKTHPAMIEEMYHGFGYNDSEGSDSFDGEDYSDFSDDDEEEFDEAGGSDSDE